MKWYWSIAVPHKEILSQCASAIKALHANGHENDPDSLTRIRDAHSYLCARVKEILEGAMSDEYMQKLRTSLHDIHPDIPYERPLSIARDLLDVAVTLDGLSNFSGSLPTGENYTAVRSDKGKILDAMFFFERLSELQS